MTEVDIVLPRKNFDLVVREVFSAGITGIFGPSGSGKTSLLHAISGLAKPVGGSIIINERILFSAEKRINIPVEKRNIGYVFQEGRLFPHLNIEKNLRYGLKKGIMPKIGFNEVVDLLELKDILNSKPARVSGGERQRTALGRSLLSSPDILLLDEPFSAVDTNLRKQILPFIIRIQQRYNIPILVVSHDLPDLLRLTSTLCVLKEGKSIGHDEYYELLKIQEIASLFGSGALVNSIEMKMKEPEPDTSLTYLSWKEKDREVLIKCDRSAVVYSEGQSLRVFIHADDIALSTEKVANVSIQNQLEGVVEEIIQRDSSLLCIVDAGIKLVVEITEASRQRLHIEPGKKVWCLIKSVAIDTLI
ncbi:molybdenum ABC transporter ATP-binding protein [Bacteroidota bacterium]